MYIIGLGLIATGAGVLLLCLMEWIMLIGDEIKYREHYRTTLEDQL